MVAITKNIGDLFTTSKFFQEIFRDNSSNAATIIAAATFNYRPEQKKIDDYSPFNGLYFTNLDNTSTVELRLNGDTENAFQIGPASTFVINAEEGINFNFFDVNNLHASNTIAIGDIKFRVSKSESKSVLTKVE